MHHVTTSTTLRPDQLTPEQLQIYKKLLSKAEEEKRAELVGIFGKHTKLSKEQKKDLRNETLQKVIESYPDQTQGSRNKAHNRNPEITELALDCLKGQKPSQSEEKGKEPKNPKPRKAISPDESETIVYTAPPADGSEESESSEDSTPFTAKFFDMIHNISARENMTEGTKNEFYEYSVEAKELLVGNPEASGVLNGLFSATHEAEILKNLTRLLHQSVASDSQCKYEEELIYVLQGVWNRKAQLQTFVDDHDEKHWNKTFNTLKEWRASHRPHKFAPTYDVTNKKISQGTSSHKPGTEKKPKEAVEKTAEICNAIVENYWMALFFSSLMQVSKKKVKERNDEIGVFLGQRNLRGYETKATNYIEKEEHVLNDNNKRPFIKELYNNIDQVLRFKETGETLYESIKLMGTLEEEDKEILNVVNGWIDIMEKELEKLKANYETIKAKGDSVCTELSKVIDIEHVPGYDPADIEYTSRWLPKPDGEAREKAVEQKNLAKRAAETQKLLIERGLKNLETRMNYVPSTVVNALSWGVTGKEISAGINVIFERLKAQRDALKDTLRSS